MIVVIIDMVSYFLGLGILKGLALASSLGHTNPLCISVDFL